jgi:hypothetical protein
MRGRSPDCKKKEVGGVRARKGGAIPHSGAPEPQRAGTSAGL